MSSKHVITVAKGGFKQGQGCKGCQVSCQSACKTSCTVGMLPCVENK
ncbi:MAG: six-cysteine peptide SCIFF [Clostridia bacterium]|nr:six-cysteine peptide SCIFF [Clostridia bacterium]